jgi:hypothetical protein
MDITRFRERWPNTKPTSPATCDRRIDIDAHNGETGDPAEDDGKVDLRDIIVIETVDGEKHEYEVVGLVDDEEHNEYAVAFSEAADEFIVTDVRGKLLEDDELAQEILDDFFVLSEESGSEEN